jgi:uroporphyrin-III C-methyltransferase
MSNKSPKVYFVGAGPGAADLITLRAQKILKIADVIIYDYLIEADEFKTHSRPDAEWISAYDILPRQENWSDLKQEKINKLMIEMARSGQCVVRLKSGDPFIFSRASEEMKALKENNVKFEIIPGVTSAQAAACETGIPLTSRKSASSVTFVTGHAASKKLGPDVDWKVLAGAGTLVLYMGISQIKNNCASLINAGKAPDTPVLIASNVSRPTCKCIRGTLADIADRADKADIKSPAIIIIGESVNEHDGILED